MLESLFKKLKALSRATLLKKTSTQVFFCSYCKIFRYTYFEEHLRAAIYKEYMILQLIVISLKGVLIGAPYRNM